MPIVSTTYKGVSPSESARLMSPLFETRKRRMSLWPHEAAACRGEYELSSKALGEVPVGVQESQ